MKPCLCCSIKGVVSLLLVLTVLPPALSAQTAPPGFTHQVFTTDDGLPTNLLTGFVQTPVGYLRIDTQDGLVRLDEGRFHGLTTAQGLSSSDVRHLYEDDDGFLWVATGGRGLIRLDLRGVGTWDDDALARIEATSYRVQDGLFDAGDDTLWFSTMGDGVRIDPAAADQRASAPVIVEPYWHETWWFYGLAALLGIALALGVVWMRVQTLRANERRLEALVQQRTAALKEALRKEEHLHREANQTRETIARQAEQLATLDKAKSRFFANISHEFRTPLTLLIGPLEDALAGRHGPLPASLQEAQKTMLRNSRRLLHLVGQLLDLAQFEAGEQQLEARLHDAGAFVQETVEVFVPLAESLHVALGWEVSAPLMLAFDRDKLETVLRNLLSNALKFTPPGGQVAVEVYAKDQHVDLVVADTGVGIAAEDLLHVFDRFYHAEGEGPPIQASTGLGLALAKEFVELHGGSLLVESTPGRGSTFTARLPREVPASSAAPVVVPEPTEARVAFEALALPGGDGETSPGGDGWASTPPNTPVPGDGLADETDRPTVLVIDDNADVRRYLHTILSPTYRIVEAEDGRQGLQAARAHLPDLIISDVMMPELDGYAFARALKEDPMLEGIPMIMLTAKAATEDQVEGLDIGADAYLTKPFERAVLEAHMRGLLAGRQRLRTRYNQPPILEMDVPPAPNPVPSQPSAFETQVRGVIAAHLNAEGFTTERLAAEMRLSYAQLVRKLRKEANTTPTALIRQVRLGQAARMLTEGAGNVSEVAYAVGFKSLSHFTRCFREHFNVTPSAYARSDEQRPEV